MNAPLANAQFTARANIESFCAELGGTSMRHVGATFVCLVFALGSASTFAQQHTMPSGKMTDEDIIKSAMSAAPEAIGSMYVDHGVGVPGIADTLGICTRWQSCSN